VLPANGYFSTLLLYLVELPLFMCPCLCLCVLQDFTRSQAQGLKLLDRTWKSSVGSRCCLSLQMRLQV